MRSASASISTIRRAACMARYLTPSYWPKFIWSRWAAVGPAWIWFRLKPAPPPPPRPAWGPAAPRGPTRPRPRNWSHGRPCWRRLRNRCGIIRAREYLGLWNLGRLGAGGFAPSYLLAENGDEVDRIQHDRRIAAVMGGLGQDFAGEGEQNARRLDHQQGRHMLLRRACHVEQPGIF